MEMTFPTNLYWWIRDCIVKHELLVFGFRCRKISDCFQFNNMVVEFKNYWVSLCSLKFLELHLFLYTIDGQTKELNLTDFIYVRLCCLQTLITEI